MTLYYSYFESPFGDALAVGREDALTGFYFVGQKYEALIDESWLHKPKLDIFKMTASRIAEYAREQRKDFDVPFAFAQGTEFQQKVWHAIAAVSFGETITYGELARRVGSPTGSRAAGAATGRNPISLIVPCHRILGSNGALTGYAGGLDRKKRFLQIEGVDRASGVLF